MGKHIAIIQGHPDASGQHFCHALADEYVKGTEDGGHEIERIDAARTDFPILWTKDEFEKGARPLSLGLSHEAIRRGSLFDSFSSTVSRVWSATSSASAASVRARQASPAPSRG